MADIHIPNDIIINILSRLDTKPLLRSRCVSTHWHRLISDPSFMNSRSHKKILFHAPQLYVLDVDHNSIAELPSPFEEQAGSVVGLPSPFEEQTGRNVLIIGTFTGIVIFVVTDYSLVSDKNTSHIHLYNPVTRASHIVHDPYSPFYKDIHLYGFAYGDDYVKIVRFRDCNHSNDSYLCRSWNTCDVLDLKTSLWSSSEILIKDTQFKDSVGTFVDGFLYWIAFEKIVALNVKEMVISEICPPNQHGLSCRLGTLYGRLCMYKNHRDIRYDVWIMKEENIWSKSCSIPLGKELGYPDRLINIMDDGRVLMMVAPLHVIIYDTSKRSNRILNLGSPIDIFHVARAIEYTETLISPLAL